MKIVSVAFNMHLDSETPFKNACPGQHHLCAVNLSLCARDRRPRKKKRCPLSPPPGHLTTVALSVQCHTSLAYSAPYRPVCLLSKCLFSTRSHNDSWLRKSFAFELLPGHLLLVDDRGITQDPRVYICSSDCSFKKYFSQVFGGQKQAARLC